MIRLRKKEGARGGTMGSPTPNSADYKVIFSLG
jgi:hypothetical protein